MTTFLTDILHASLLGTSVVPQTIATATSTKGDGVDCQTSDGPISAIATTGNCGDGDSAFYVKLQESVDDVDGNYADIVGAVSATYSGATAGDKKTFALPTTLRTKRWVRAVVVTTTSGTVSCIIAVLIIGRKKITGTGTGYLSASE